MLTVLIGTFDRILIVLIGQPRTFDRILIVLIGQPTTFVRIFSHWKECVL